MKLKTSISTGSYNWCAPKEKQLLIHARIEDCSFAPEPISLYGDIEDEGYYKQHLRDAPIDTIIEAIAEQRKKFTFSSSFEKEAKFSEFINLHYTELYLSAEQDRLLEIEQTLSRLSEERLKVIDAIKTAKDELQMVEHFLELPFIPY